MKTKSEENNYDSDVSFYMSAEAAHKKTFDRFNIFKRNKITPESNNQIRSEEVFYLEGKTSKGIWFMCVYDDDPEAFPAFYSSYSPLIKDMLRRGYDGSCIIQSTPPQSKYLRKAVFKGEEGFFSSYWGGHISGNLEANVFGPVDLEKITLEVMKSLSKNK